MMDSKSLLGKTSVALGDRISLLQPFLEARKCDNVQKCMWLHFGAENMLWVGLSC